MKRLILLFLLIPALHSFAQTEAFVRGADVSWCTEMEADGKVFRNADGEVTDIFALLRRIGMTAVRLRVWVNPERLGYGAWSDKADVLKKARRAQAQGLDIMIDFHYSDFFVDPGTQATPLDWQGFSLDQVKEALAAHTKDVLQTLKSEGIEPKWVQVGNETNNGMIWDYGRIDWNLSDAARYTNYVALSNVGYDAVKSVLPHTAVIVHLGNTKDALWFYEEFKGAGGKFDMIGLSHYPTIEEWNSTDAEAAYSNANAASQVSEAIGKFQVPVMICETGFDAWQQDLAAEVMEDLMNRMKVIPGCAGVFYWEPEVDGQWKPAYYSQTGWGAYGKGAFTTDGRPTKILDAFSEKTNGIHTILQGKDCQEAHYDLLGRRIDMLKFHRAIRKKGASFGSL